MILATLLTCAAISVATLQGPALPTPSKRQLAWQKMEYYAFVHFGPNTFTDKEWGGGDEDPSLFNPTALDCRQWVRAFKDAGMKGVIITAKHHDGFCLWPSKYSQHTVAQSKWRNGRGDVLRELSKACKAEGIKMGVYLSPWDRNHPAYGTLEYNQSFADMLREVLTNYGPIFEVWFDGANGEGPNGKRQVYDWDLFIRTVRECQPDAVIFSDAGPDIRWVGNESGHAADTCWSTINRGRFTPGSSVGGQLTSGNPNGKDWVPPECDVSIRPGWFYHSNQDSQVKNADQLLSIYYQSVGQNGSLLLNVPPDRRGLIHDNDIHSLMEFRRARERTFGKKIAQERGTELTFSKPERLDHLVIREDIAKGQRVESFQVEAKTPSGWSTIARGTTIGNKRILRLEPIETTGLRLTIDKAKAEPQILSLTAYASPLAENPMQIETKQQKERRMAWFKDARFGMFIHWGLYAIPAGVWKGKDYGGAGEWLMNAAKIKAADYEPLQQQFNPAKFDAERWVQIAKDAGMKYIVITTKHHDGFCLFETKETPYNILNTAFARDPMKELAAACKKAGIRLCFYHSIMDWHHPDYMPRREWDPRPDSKPDLDRYVATMKRQIKELLTQYGPIGVLWFDGEWEGTWTWDRGFDLDRYVRSLQPEIIINNRVGPSRGGMAGMSQGERPLGDYGTPEQQIPSAGLPGVEWESCMTMNGTWGFVASDKNWKSAETLVQNLVDCASKGGNYLLNVGPTALGEIPDASIERLEKVGAWLKENGEAIYGTVAGPFPKPLPWGRVTRKGGKLYAHVFDPKVAEIELPGLESPVKRAYPLGVPSTPLPMTKTGSGLKLRLPSVGSISMPRVFVLEIIGEPKVVAIPLRQASDGLVTLEAIDARADGGIQYESDKQAIGYWTNPTGTVRWEFELRKPGRFAVAIELACEDGFAGSDYVVQVDGQVLKGTVAATGGWSQFVRVELGTVQLIKPGMATIEIRAVKMPKSAVMNVRRVQLKPL